MKNLIKSSFILTLTIILLLSSFVVVPVSASAVSDATKGVVRILCQSEDGSCSTGTAFYVGKNDAGKDIFITNRHVVTDDDFEVMHRIYILKDNFTSYDMMQYLYTDANRTIISNPKRTSEWPDGFYPTPGVNYLSNADIDTSRTVSCDVLYTTYSDDEPDVAIIQAADEVPGVEPLPLLSTKDVSVGSAIYLLGFPGESDKAATTLDDSYKLVRKITSNVYLWGLEVRKQLKATPDEVTVTKGIVSRLTEYDQNNRKTISVVQTDAQMNHGNSGGPMITEDGAVIAINTFYTIDDSNYSMNNYSTAIDYAIEQLKVMGISYQMPADAGDVAPTPERNGNMIVIVACVAGVLAVIIAVVVVMLLRRKGQKPAYILGQGGEKDGVRVDLKKDGIQLGRNPGLDVQYSKDAVGISRLHCKLCWDKNKLMLVDLSSTSGTFVNGKGQIAPNTSMELHVGDTFYLGENTNTFIVK